MKKQTEVGLVFASNQLDVVGVNYGQQVARFES